MGGSLPIFITPAESVLITCHSNQLYIMKKKAIKGIRKKLIVSLKKDLKASNKSLVSTLDKDLKKAIKVLSAKKTAKGLTKKKASALDA